MTIADRQGDVVLIPIGNDPVEIFNTTDKRHQIQPDKLGRIVLAEGEVTGHAHVLENKGVALFKLPNSEAGHSLLVVMETTVKRGDLIEGKVIGELPGGTIRFQQQDGTILRFLKGDIEITKQGAKVKRAYTPLKHDEHDAIPVGRGVYTVAQHQTAVVERQRVARQIVSD